MHIYPIDIFYDDTDALGIVYHANFIKYMERARTMLFKEKNMSLATVTEAHQILFVVKRIEIEYLKPVKLLQKIHVLSEVSDLSRASLTFNQRICFDPTNMDTIICSGKVVIVCTNKELKPCPIPEKIVRELNSEN